MNEAKMLLIDQDARPWRSLSPCQDDHKSQSSWLGFPPFLCGMPWFHWSWLLSSKSSQVGTISRSSGVYFFMEMVDFLFPLTLPFIAILLKRSCPSQSSPVPGDSIIESKRRDRILPRIIQMFEGTFTKMTLASKRRASDVSELLRVYCPPHFTLL